MAQFRTILSLISLALGSGACDDDGRSGDGDGPGAMAACEEACLETDACDDTISYSSGYCENSCSKSLDQQTDIGCTTEFRSLSRCKAAANTCPVPDCLAETREYDECVSESDSCAGVCIRVARCSDPGAIDPIACTEDCELASADAASYGCEAEYKEFLFCDDSCDPNSATVCEAEWTAYRECSSD